MRAPLNLAAVDLNLMVVFDALMAERHLSRAAARVGLSQPAMSHALRRLRGLLGDELFTRGPGGMDPTPRALELADPVGGALDRLRSALAGEPTFDPATSTQTFTLTMSDGGMAGLLPRLIPRLRAEAPGVNLLFLASGAREGVEHVLSGAADLGLGVYPNLDSRLESQATSTVRLVCIADASHPALAGGLDLEHFLALPHVGIDVGHDSGASIDSLLDTMGLKRRIMLHLPHFMVAADAVIGSDLLAVVPERLIRAEDRRRLSVYPLPIAAPDVGMRVVWRARQSHDPAVIWLRLLVAEAAGRTRVS